MVANLIAQRVRHSGNSGATLRPAALTHEGTNLFRVDSQEDEENLSAPDRYSQCTDTCGRKFPDWDRPGPKMGRARALRRGKLAARASLAWPEAAVSAHSGLVTVAPPARGLLSASRSDVTSDHVTLSQCDNVTASHDDRARHS